MIASLIVVDYLLCSAQVEDAGDCFPRLMQLPGGSMLDLVLLETVQTAAILDRVPISSFDSSSLYLFTMQVLSFEANVK